MADDRAYRIQLLFDAASEGYRALVPELEIDLKATTRAEAIEAAEAAIEEKVEAVATAGEVLPAAIDATPLEAGELTLQLNGELLRELRFQANRAGLEVEALALQLVAQGVGQLEGRRPPRGPKPKAERPAAATTEDDEDRQPDSNEERGGRGRGRGRGRGGNKGHGRGGRRGEGYRPEMENQADFLAYVRDMEKGGRRR